MEKISNDIYINNRKMIIIKFDSNALKCYKNLISFRSDVNRILMSFNDIDILKGIHAISPNLATKTEFLLTNKCNLNCIYCYSSASRSSETLSLHDAKIVIDRLIHNAIIKNIKCNRKKTIYVSFHGGGEPACEFELLKEIVIYAKNQCYKYGIEIKLDITTNLAYYDTNILDFYLDNDFSIHVSMDGIEKIQNLHRPFTDGRPSFDIVKKNMDYLSKHYAKFSARLTITSISIKYALESYNYLLNQFPNLESIRLAPLQITEKYDKSPNLKEYLALLEAVDNMQNHNTVNMDEIFNCSLCASTRFEQMIISPQSMITTCHEDPTSANYVYGKIENGYIKIDMSQVDLIRKEQRDNLHYGTCCKCSIRMLCIGNCKHRRLSQSREVFCAIRKYTLTRLIHKAFNYPDLISEKSLCKQIEFPTYDNNPKIQLLLHKGHIL